MVTELLDAALRYAELGYPVFPCAPGGSIPVTEHGFHDASINPDVIRAFWSRHPDANIGLATAGLLVIDIDGANNPWPGDPDQIADLQSAPMSITPRGGSHHIFRQPEGAGIRCTTSVIAEKVDTRADGGYIVVPPSVRQQGPYNWIDGMELDIRRDQLPLPPSWILEALKPKEKQTFSVGNVIPDGQRNSTLFRLGCSMRRNGLDADEIYIALKGINQKRCRPSLPDDEVHEIAKSAARKDVDQTAVAVVEDHYSQVMAKASPSEYGDPGATPERLFDVPGFVSDVMRYTLETAPYPEKSLAFCGALALQATLAGRTFCDEMDNRTNLYVLSLANSGTGKEHPRKVNARILEALNESGRIGNNFASSEGIEDALHQQPKNCMLFQVDEIDGLLLKITNGKEPRFEAIATTLLQMYSQANGVYALRTRAGKEPMKVNQPHLTILGTAVPKYFYESLSERLMTNGLLARMLIFESGSRGRGREATFKEIPEDITDQAKMYLQANEFGGNLNRENPRPKCVRASEEARKSFKESWAWYDDAYAASEASGDAVGMSIWARGFEKVRRLALIYALSENPMSPLIDSGAVQWATELVAHQTKKALYMSGKHSSAGAFADKQRQLLDVLEVWKRENGTAWCPYWHISRKLRWSTRDHEEVRKSLIDADYIEYKHCGNLGKKGRPAKLCRLKIDT